MQDKIFKYNESTEEEIDLVDLIRVLKRRSKLIVGIFLSVTIISIIAGISKFKSGERTTTIISYNFNEISDGLNPDGSNFNPNLISSNEVLNSVIKNVNIENEKLNITDIREKLNIIPIIPNYMRTKIKSELEQGIKSSFSPSNYEVTLKTITDFETTKQILQAIVIEYGNYYRKKYAQTDVIPSITLNSGYEYRDYLNITESNLKYIEKIIKSKKDQGFISKQSGVSFANILNKINLIREVDFAEIDQYVAMEGSYKNKETVIRKLNYKEEKLKNEKQKKLNEVDALNTVLKIYKPEKTNMIVSGMEGTFERKQTDDYYSKLIKDVALAAVEAGNISQEIKSLEEQKERVINNKKTSQIDVQKILNRLEKNMGDLIIMSNKVLEEYNNRFVTNYVKTISPINHVQDKKGAMLIIAIGMTLGLFLGIFAAFIKEFFKEI